MSQMLHFGADVVVLARDRAKKMGILRNSLTKGERTVNGFVGEIVFKQFCEISGVPVNHVDAFTHDFESVNGTKIEVKTKTRSVLPQPYFDNGVCCHNTTQCGGPNGYYVFLQLMWTNKEHTQGVVFFCGAMLADEFRRKAAHVRPDAAPASNGFVPTQGQLSMRIDECMDKDDFFAVLRKKTSPRPADTQYTARAVSAASRAANTSSSGVKIIQTPTNNAPRNAQQHGNSHVELKA